MVLFICAFLSDSVKGRKKPHGSYRTGQMWMTLLGDARGKVIA